MSKLSLDTNIDRHDDLYEALVQFHDGLLPEESLKLNAKLILLLANHIGDIDVVREAIAIVQNPNI